MKHKNPPRAKIMSYPDRAGYHKTIRQKIREVALIVADFNGYTLSEICENSRKGGIVLIRQLIHKITKELTDAPYVLIGQEIGEKGHDTCIHSVKVIDTYISTKNKFVTKLYEESKSAAMGCVIGLIVPNPILDPIFMHNVNTMPQL